MVVETCSGAARSDEENKEGEMWRRCHETGNIGLGGDDHAGAQHDTFDASVDRKEKSRAYSQYQDWN